MTYGEGLIKGLMSLGGLAILWFLVIKPFADGFAKNVEAKEKKKEERFKAYAIYDEMREIFSNIKIDRTTKEERVGIKNKLKFYENWLKSPEAFFLVKKERVKWIKDIRFVLGE